MADLRLSDLFGTAPTGGGDSSCCINYCENPDFETDVTGWEASGANLTIVRSTSPTQVSRGVAAGHIHNIGGVSALGEYVYYRFTIDNADILKTLSFSFYYNQANANENYKVQVVADPLGTPAVIYEGETLGPASFARVADLWSSTAATTYELRIVSDNTSTASRPIYIDSVIIGPQQLTQAPIMGDWQDMGPLEIVAEGGGAAKGTTTFDKVFMRRVGDSAEFHMSYHQSGAGSNGSGVYNILLPAGIVIDDSKCNPNGNRGRQAFGIAVVNDARVGSIYYGQTNDRLRVNVTDSGTEGEISGTLYGLGASNRGYGFHFTIPVQGWASGGQQTAMNQPFTWAERYAASAVRVTGGDPTRLGEYRTRREGTDVAPDVAPTGAAGMLLTSDDPSGGEINAWDFFVGKNMVVKLMGMYATATKSDPYSSTTYMSASGNFRGPDLRYNELTGVVSVRCASNAGASAAWRYNNNGGASFLTSAYFDLLVTPETNPLALVSEAPVLLRVTDDSAQSVTAQVTPFNYNTVTIDTHGGWSTNRYTAPRAGVYGIMVECIPNAGPTSVELWVNGVQWSIGDTASSSNQITGARDTLVLAQGDYVEVRGGGNWTRGNTPVFEYLNIWEIR